MLQKVVDLSIMVAVLLSIAACDGGPKIDDASLKIESEWDAVLVVRDYLKDKYFDGENGLKLVVEEHGLNWDVSNDNYDVNDPPSRDGTNLDGDRKLRRCHHVDSQLCRESN